MYLILGFTKRTSYSLARYLLKHYQYPLIISDSCSDIEKESLIQELSSLGSVINQLGNQRPELLQQYPIEKIFLSPGVPRAIPIVQEALRLGIEVLNDIEFFYSEFPNRMYLAITGTDGKTTVTTWLGDVVQRQKKVVLAGNIGNPIFEYSDHCYNDYIFILELSSFQLESLNQFHAHIATVINIHEDHLDRYPDKDSYALAKKNVFLNQTNHDYAVLNPADSYFTFLCRDLNSSLIYIADKDWYTDREFIYFQQSCFFDLSLLKVVGIHNIQNALFVCALAKLLQIDECYIQQSLAEFQGVPHRLQYIGEFQGISFYNDSKATTAQSVRLALESFDKPVILLAGGRSKGIDFSLLNDIAAKKTKKVFFFGEIANSLSQSWSNVDGEVCISMQDAFNRAVAFAKSGDTILLSPGGTSLDEYESYSARGNHFIELIQNIYKN